MLKHNLVMFRMSKLQKEKLHPIYVRLIGKWYTFVQTWLKLIGIALDYANKFPLISSLVYYEIKMWHLLALTIQINFYFSFFHFTRLKMADSLDAVRERLSRLRRDFGRENSGGEKENLTGSLTNTMGKLIMSPSLVVW